MMLGSISDVAESMQGLY